MRRHPLIWSILALCVAGPAASLVHVLHEQHSVCVEHPGATHHADSDGHQVEVAALRANPERFPESLKIKQHDHCGAMGVFDRACEKAPGNDPAKPAIAPKKTDIPATPHRALPDVIYAYAPKQSPPRV